MCPHSKCLLQKKSNVPSKTNKIHDIPRSNSPCLSFFHLPPPPRNKTKLNQKGNPSPLSVTQISQRRRENTQQPTTVVRRAHGRVLLDADVDVVQQKHPGNLTTTLNRSVHAPVEYCTTDCHCTLSLSAAQEHLCQRPKR